MPNIVVLIKQVPDTWSERKLTDGDFTLDREAADAVLDEINERAVEEALLIKEAQGGEVTVLSAGPDRATEAIRKALSMGADKAIHINDPAIHGSDAVQTAWVLAGALGQVEGVELVIAGNEATDGRAGAVPAIIAEYLGIPQLTHVRKLAVDGEKVSTLEAFYKRIWAHPNPDDEIRLTVLQGAEVKQITIKAIDRMQTLRKPAGI